ncbi:choice-of-anchor E domain-containing protein [Luteolibacter yonseiensis]|uniref:Choice-of-anchor E domain-containing protein n=1 Tax=Luteolibacter yonseiensis TaxID=1144680 RepID=A0A934R8W5_9BACT|nr:choice-of-anchor E domain-containing protein [Luteolibacter yonseiensis]MBK1818356.1 choice-of-anchor E domain-containing protein [Luteolibacter yonseiensis]
MKNIAYPLILTAALISAAPAATLIQTKSFAFLPDDSQDLTYNKFDTSLGSLISVSVSVTLNKTGGQFEVDNDSTTAGTITLEHNVIGGLSVVSGDVGLLRDDLTAIGSNGSLTASSVMPAREVFGTSGDDTDTFDATGQSDYVRFNPADASVSDSGTIASFAQSAFEGTGTFVLRANALQSVNVTGLGGLQQAITVANVSGEVTVTYNYMPIPEPASALLGGIGCLLLLRRPRR